MKNKKLFYAIALLIAVFCKFDFAFSQATTSSFFPLTGVPNTPSAGGADFLGWAFGTPLNVDIRHDGIQNIDFYTGGFVAAVNKRMTILGTAAGLIQGHVGIGLNFAPLNDMLDISPDWVNFPWTRLWNK